MISSVPSSIMLKLHPRPPAHERPAKRIRLVVDDKINNVSFQKLAPSLDIDNRSENSLANSRDGLIVKILVSSSSRRVGTIFERKEENSGFQEIDSDSDNDENSDHFLKRSRSSSSSSSDFEESRPTKRLRTDTQSHISISSDSVSYNSESESELQEWEIQLEEFRRYDNPEGLIKFLNLKPSLSKIAREDIFEEVFLSDNLDLIKSSISMILNEDQRYRLFELGIKFNDLEVIKAAVEGANGKRSLVDSPFFKTSPLLKIYSYKQRVSQGVINYLQPIFNVTKKEIKDVEWRVYLANSYSIPESSFVIKKEKFEYEGAGSVLFIDKLLSAFKNFKLEYPKKFSEDILNQLIELLEYSKPDICTQSLWARYSIQKLPILFHSGYKSEVYKGEDGAHQINVVLRPDKKVLICNLGDLAPTPKQGKAYHPVRVYNIDTMINIDLLEEIQGSGRSFTRAKAKKFLYKQLPKLLNGGVFSYNERITTRITENWVGKLQQTASDCVSRSIWASLMANTALNELNEREVKEIYSENEIDFNDEKSEEIFSERFKQIHFLKQFTGLWGIEGYLKFCSKDPKNIDKYLMDCIFSKLEKKIDSENPLYSLVNRLKTQYDAILASLN